MVVPCVERGEEEAERAMWSLGLFDGWSIAELTVARMNWWPSFHASGLW